MFISATFWAGLLCSEQDIKHTKKNSPRRIFADAHKDKTPFVCRVLMLAFGPTNLDLTRVVAERHPNRELPGIPKVLKNRSATDRATFCEADLSWCNFFRSDISKPTNLWDCWCPPKGFLMKLQKGPTPTTNNQANNSVSFTYHLSDCSKTHPCSLPFEMNILSVPEKFTENFGHYPP